MPLETDLFPLLLSPFETYMLLDDSPKHPMTFSVEYQLHGTIDRLAMTKAVRESLAGHPLLTSTVNRTALGAYAWNAGSPDHVQVQWVDCGFQIRPDDLRIDLSEEPGIRVWACDRGSESVLVFLFHHAACDGIGSIQFVNDLLVCYSNGDGGREDLEIRQSNAALLPTRGHSRWGELPAPVTRWQALRSFVAEVWRVVGHRPEPLRRRNAPSRSSEAAITLSGMVQQTLDADLTKRIRNHAREKGVTMNDLLLRDLFVVLQQWNEGQDDSRYLRVTVPTNLRQQSDWYMPAVNVIGYAFLTRRVGETRDHESLLQSLHLETEAIRKWRLGNFALEAMRSASRVPRVFRYLLQRNRCMATTVFSNLGDVSRYLGRNLPRRGGQISAGTLTIKRVLVAPPPRRMTYFSLAAIYYGREMTICLRRDPVEFNETDAVSFLDKYVEMVRATAARQEFHGD